MSSSSLPSVFVDITVLLDYCRVSNDSQRYADDVLNKMRGEGEVHVSSNAEAALNKRVDTLQALLTHLYEKGTEYLHESEEPVDEYHAEILNYTYLSQVSNFDIQDRYRSDISTLQERLSELDDLDDFRKEVYEMVQQSASQRHELEERIINSRFEMGGQDTFMLSVGLNDHVIDEEQSKCLIQAAFWCQKNLGNSIIIRDACDAFRNREEVASTLANVAGDDPVIFSPRELIEETAAFTVN